MEGYFSLNKIISTFCLSFAFGAIIECYENENDKVKWLQLDSNPEPLSS